jgi:protein transport protein SEC13
MAQVITNTTHNDMIVSAAARLHRLTRQHDAVLDYYGRRLATCSSDRTVKIFEIEGETHRHTETLKG